MTASEFAPHMAPDELALLTRFIPEKGSILEFGCGGSTQLFFEKGAKDLISVESDATWLKNLLANPVVSTFHKYERWLPLYADVGPVGDWGMPVNKTPQLLWLNYHQYCWDKFSKRHFDLILIDGRFRVACICQSLLRCETDNLTLVVHDFWNRPEYHIVLDFLEPIDQASSLGVFKTKKDNDWRKLSLVLQKHQFDFM